jgi:hypothetical protein
VILKLPRLPLSALVTTVHWGPVRAGPLELSQVVDKAVQFGVCCWLVTYIPCRELAASARRLIARSHIRRISALPG